MNLFLHMNKRDKVMITVAIIFAEGKLFSNHTLIFDDSLRLAALMVRTWAVWHQNRYIGAGLATLWIALLITACYFATDFVKSFVSKFYSFHVRFVPLMFVVIPKPYAGFRGCLLTAENNSPRESYILLAVVEAGDSEETNVSCRFLYL
jgi:hypothetical protein